MSSEIFDVFGRFFSGFTKFGFFSLSIRIPVFFARGYARAAQFYGSPGVNQVGGLPPALSLFRSLGSVRFVCALRELLNRIPARVSPDQRLDPWVGFPVGIFQFPMIFDERLSFRGDSGALIDTEI